MTDPLRQFVDVTLQSPPDMPDWRYSDVPDPTKPFATDGCSGGMSWAWRTFAGKPPPWEGACIHHDRAYWMGGNPARRLRADRELRRSIHARGHPVMAEAVYLAVRAGGSNLWPFSWRWGYGHE